MVQVTVNYPVERAGPPLVRARSSCDDSRVDYTSLLGEADRRKRISVEVEDTDLKDSMKLKKMYREIQRHVNCNDKNKV